MLGWDISVYRQVDSGSSPAKADSADGARLAVWQTGLDGLQWIDDLVKVGRAVDLGGNGYPCRYTAQAQYLVPSILKGPPSARRSWVFGQHDVVTPAWNGKTVIDRAATGDCRLDEWLLVVAWDES